MSQRAISGRRYQLLNSGDLGKKVNTYIDLAETQKETTGKGVEISQSDQEDFLLIYPMKRIWLSE